MATDVFVGILIEVIYYFINNGIETAIIGLQNSSCGYSMVISRLPSKNGKKIAYYSCGNWKNKGTTVCHCNSIRVDKANKAIFDKITEFLRNDRMIKAVVDKLNREHE